MMIYFQISLALIILYWDILATDAFSGSTATATTTSKISSITKRSMLSFSHDDDVDSLPTRISEEEEQFLSSSSSLNRRSFMIASVVSAVTIGTTTSPAVARDELYKPNPLTNSVLEQMRIWEQAEKDNIKYGGELESGDAGNKGKVYAYPKLLIPILQIDKDLTEVQGLVHDDNKNSQKQSWKKALSILQKDQYQKINFKKTFNAYGDNIYYSDPDRANVYLGGGATPKNEQSIAYLLRNDVLTNIESLQAELEYLLKEDDGVEDLYSYADIAVGAMKKYLAIVPPQELEAANKLLLAASSSN